MELEKIMKLKVILFTNENFFFNFKNILLKLAYDIYIEKQHELLTDRIENNKISFSSSKWFYIMKLIFSKVYIPDFSKIKDLENRKNDIILHTKSYETDKLQYLYLKSVCLKKLKKLNFLSFKLKISLINIVDIYCDLCFKEIINNRKKHPYKKDSKELIYNRHNGINIINKKYSLMTLGNKKKSKINTLIINNLLKAELSTLNNNKNKKQNDDVITHIISKNSNTLDIFAKKSNSARQKLLYCNSFTRLFIGETDKDSILQRHLSNILVLKQNNLNVNGSYVDLSEIYLKKIFKKIYKRNSRKLLIDDVLKKTLEKYEINQKYLDEYNKKDNKNTNTPKKSHLMKRKFNKEKIFPFNNKVNIEEQILKTYSYDKNKNNLRKVKNINSAKVRNNLNLNSNKKNIKKENESSILIENLCKELSDSICFSKRNSNKNSKNNLWIKTETNYLFKNKNFNNKKKYNDFYYRNNFRTNTIKSYHSSKKEYPKDFLIKKDIFIIK